MGLAVRGPGEDPHEICLVVEEAGELTGHGLLDPATEAIIAVGGHGPIGQVDVDQLVLDIVGVGRGLEGHLVGLAGAVPVRVIRVRETVIFQQAVGRIVDVGGREVGAEAIAHRVVGEGLIGEQARERMVGAAEAAQGIVAVAVQPQPVGEGLPVAQQVVGVADGRDFDAQHPVAEGEELAGGVRYEKSHRKESLSRFLIFVCIWLSCKTRKSTEPDGF